MPKGKAVRKLSGRKYRTKDRARYKATTKIGTLVRYGKIEKQPCFICGSINAHTHHPDYSKPLFVVWLCEEHHLWMHGKRKIHVGIKSL